MENVNLTSKLMLFSFIAPCTFQSGELFEKHFGKHFTFINAIYGKIITFVVALNEITLKVQFAFVLLLFK